MDEFSNTPENENNANTSENTVESEVNAPNLFQSEGELNTDTSDVPQSEGELNTNTSDVPQSEGEVNTDKSDTSNSYDRSYDMYMKSQGNQSQYYSQQQNAPAYSTDDRYTTYGQTPNYPYASQPQQAYGTGTQWGTPQKPKSTRGNKIGKTIFVAALCLCLVVASLAIGQSVRNNNASLPNSAESTTDAAIQTGDVDGPSVTISPTPVPSEVASGTMTAAEIYKKVKNINVGVLVYSNNNLAGEGSGVILGEDSTGKYTYIITCAHVISDYGTNIRIRFSDNSDIDAKVLGYDKKTDIGVLRVEKAGLEKANFGDVSSVAVGQTIYAIGNPGGTEFFGSFTMGMISAVDRPVDSAVGYSQPCIQHTAAINPGNSGGALLNEYGQVIGINSAKIAETDYEGMGFAVPLNTVKAVADELILHGYVTNRPKLGITYSPISQSQIYSIIVQSNGLPTGSIIIREIDSESDLNNKSVQINDLIIKANGKDLTSSNTLPDIIDGMAVGDTITLTICRINNDYTINKPFDVKVKLIEDKGYTETEQETSAPYFNPFE